MKNKLLLASLLMFSFSAQAADAVVERAPSVTAVAPTYIATLGALGGNCSQEGQVGRTNTNKLLFCKSGKWMKGYSASGSTGATGATGASTGGWGRNLVSGQPCWIDPLYPSYFCK